MTGAGADCGMEGKVEDRRNGATPGARKIGARGAGGVGDGGAPMVTVGAATGVDDRGLTEATAGGSSRSRLAMHARPVLSERGRPEMTPRCGGRGSGLQRGERLVHDTGRCFLSLTLMAGTAGKWSLTTSLFEVGSVPETVPARFLRCWRCGELFLRSGCSLMRRRRRIEPLEDGVGEWGRNAALDWADAPLALKGDAGLARSKSPNSPGRWWWWWSKSSESYS